MAPGLVDARPLMRGERELAMALHGAVMFLGVRKHVYGMPMPDDLADFDLIGRKKVAVAGRSALRERRGAVRRSPGRCSAAAHGVRWDDGPPPHGHGGRLAEPVPDHRRHPAMRVDVEYRAGRGGEETPLRLHLGTRTLEVAEVLDRWFGADYTYVKLVASDGDTYILRHDAGSDAWELVMFRSGGQPG